MRRAGKYWTLEQRLSEKSIPEPNSGCLLWMGDGNGKGYGKMKVRGQMMTTHRAAWEVNHGPIPEGLHVCHKCDVPACINPDHLFLGTAAANQADKAAKGRSAKGENHGRNKLTPDQVIEIFHSPDPERKIAKRFGISRSAVTHIKKKDNWAHLLRDLI